MIKIGSQAVRWLDTRKRLDFCVWGRLFGKWKTNKPFSLPLEGLWRPQTRAQGNMENRVGRDERTRNYH